MSDFRKIAKLALIQMKVVESRTANILHAKEMIKIAATKGAKFAILPEYFTTFNKHSDIINNAETVPFQSIISLLKAAYKQKLHIIGGTIPEQHMDHIFSTCYIVNYNGQLQGMYRKTHLLDINVPNINQVKESDTITAGDKTTSCQFLINKEKLKIGFGIGHELWIPELANKYGNQGCGLMVYLSTFNKINGLKHWENLLRIRALDNQMYVAAVSAARDESSTSPTAAWGHSTVVDPWGKVIASTDEKEDIVYANIDLNYVAKVREQIPIHKQKRHDLYASIRNTEKIQ